MGFKSYSSMFKICRKKLENSSKVGTLTTGQSWWIRHASGSTTAMSLMSSPSTEVSNDSVYLTGKKNKIDLAGWVFIVHQGLEKSLIHYSMLFIEICILILCIELICQSYGKFVVLNFQY